MAPADRTVAMAADHAGLPLRPVVAEAVAELGLEPLLLGVATGEPVDYPDVAEVVAAAIAEGRAGRGVVVCGSGAGVTVAANRYPLVRAAVAHEAYTGRQMVEHDHVNVLALGARVVGPALARDVVEAFCSASFSGEQRHARRLRTVLELSLTVRALQQLRQSGQSIWLDSISKQLLQRGTLARYISQLGVTGVTSNPTILERAISASADYDDAVRAWLADGLQDPEEIAFAVVLDDIRTTADLLRPTFDATEGADGYVSLEVSPSLVDDPEGTVDAGRRLFAQADRPNVMIKVPGTDAGQVAVERLIADGVPVNVTLLFSANHYRGAVEAYLGGIEQRIGEGGDPKVGSVASVFVSRWDAAVDAVVPADLVGQLGVTAMQQTCAIAAELLAGGRWKRLAEAGARPQRLLWASTATKNPDLPDTYYVGRLAASGTVNTVPEKTLLAFADHGAVCELLQPDLESAEKCLTAFAKAGVDTDALAAKLQRDGADSFVESWNALLDCVATKAATLTV